MKDRIITRTYTKKDGTVVTKTYNYKPISPSFSGKRGTKLTTKTGNLVKRFDKITKDLNINEYEAVVDYARAATLSHKVVTLEQALAHIRDPKNKLLRFLANMGITIQDIIEALEERGITVNEAWLSDPSHWQFTANEEAIILLPNGQQAYFVFNYYSQSFLIEVLA